jgi:hypothetical protein
MTPEQRKFFRALCGLIAESGMKWGGRQRSAQDWCVLLISAHAAAQGEEVGEILEGLEGEVVNLMLMREPSMQMSQGRASSLIDYVLALAHTHRIKVPARAGREFV